MSQEKIESEGFRNQAMTAAAAERMRTPQNPSTKTKVVALKLDDREQMALRLLGGADALKQLLCPPNLCLACRDAPVAVGSPFEGLCSACWQAHPNG